MRRLLQMPAELAAVRAELAELGRTLRKPPPPPPPPPPRLGQIMILWDGHAAGFYSIAFELTEPRQIVSEQPDFPIPAGAWLVAVGCLMSQVCVGRDLQDVGSGVAGIPLRVIRLRDAVPLGVRLRAVVVPAC